MPLPASSARTSPPQRRAPRLRALVATLLVTAAACGGDTGPRPARSAGGGTLVLAEQSLAVRTSFCVADGVRAAAVGHGISDDGPFVVVVRAPGSLSVKFGVRDELATPPPGAAWLTATGTVAVRAGDGRIEGTGEVRPVDAGAGTATRPATIDLRCGDQT